MKSKKIPDISNIRDLLNQITYEYYVHQLEVNTYEPRKFRKKKIV